MKRYKAADDILWTKITQLFKFSRKLAEQRLEKAMWYEINDVLANHVHRRYRPRLRFEGSGREGNRPQN